MLKSILSNSSRLSASSRRPEDVKMSRLALYTEWGRCWHWDWNNDLFSLFCMANYFVWRTPSSLNCMWPRIRAVSTFLPSGELQGQPSWECWYYYPLPQSLDLASRRLFNYSTSGSRCGAKSRAALNRVIMGRHFGISFYRCQKVSWYILSCECVHPMWIFTINIFKAA